MLYSTSLQASITHYLAEKGELDDKGNPIIPVGKIFDNRKDYEDYKLVLLFNRLFPVGTKFKFRELPNDNDTITEFTVSEPAFLAENFANAPMVYVRERIGTLFTISPDHVVYDFNLKVSFPL